MSSGGVASRKVTEETREAPFLDSLKAALASCVVASLSIGWGQPGLPREKCSVEAGAASDLAPCREPGWERAPINSEASVPTQGGPGSLCSWGDTEGPTHKLGSPTFQRVVLGEPPRLGLLRRSLESVCMQFLGWP